MSTPITQPRTPPPGRRVLVAGAVAVLAAVSACGEGAGSTDTVTSPAQRELLAAVQKSSSSSFRFEARFASASDVLDDALENGEVAAEPALYGSGADGWLHTTVDLAAAVPPMAEAMGADTEDADIPPGDYTFESITDETVAYVHWPMLRTVGGGGPAAPGSASTLDAETREALLGLGEGWGRVDLEGLSPAEVPQMLDAAMLDPLLFLDMVEEGRDVESTGTVQIDGADARGLRADVSFESMLVAQGIDPADVNPHLEDELARHPDIDPDEADAAVADLMAVEMPIEVWVDDDGRVRRAVTLLDFRAIEEAAGEMIDEPMPDDLGGIVTTVDTFDYDDPSIEVTPPAAWTDVTEAVLHIADL